MASNKNQDIATAQSFERILEAKNEKQVKTMTAFSSFCGLVTVLSVGALLVALPFKSVEYKVIAVNTVSGQSQLLTSVKDKNLSNDEALGRQYGATYIKLREGYNYPSLQDDYNQVQEMSNNAVKSDYINFFAGPNAPDVVNRNGDTYVGIRILSQLISKGTEPDMLDSIRYEKTIRNLGTGNVTKQYWTARITYHFEPNKKMNEDERDRNAMGYVVTSYETVQESRGN